jgi:hypothetical protein
MPRGENLVRGGLAGLVVLGGAGAGYEVVRTIKDIPEGYGAETKIIAPDVTLRPNITIGETDGRGDIVPVEADEKVTQMAVKIVDPGDTWESLAHTFELDVDELKRVNTHIKSEEPKPMDMLCLPFPGYVCPKLK